MRLILRELSQNELTFLLRLLNAAGATTELFRDRPVVSDRSGKTSETAFKTTRLSLRHDAYLSGEDAIWLDKRGERLRRSYEKGKATIKMRQADAWFRLAESERRINEMIEAWTWARVQLVNTVVNFRKNPGNFVHWPSIIGLPAHHPAVLLNNPSDLVGWMITRGMANRQLQRFVKCARASCGKFGLRERAKKDAKFHSPACQMLANAESRKLRPDGDLGYVVPAPRFATTKPA